jgi:hypothetical protein
MKKRLGLVCGLAIGTWACTPDTFQAIQISVKPSEVLTQGPILQAVAQGRVIGSEIASAALLLLGFYLWYQAQKGQPWVTILKESVWGGVIAGWLLATAGNVAGPEQWIYNAGQWLGTTVGPPDGYMMGQFKGLIQALFQLFQSINQPFDDASQLPVRVAQAVSFVVTGVNGGTLVVLNSLGVWLIKGIAGLAYTYLIALYWVILPFIAWTAILPTTRGVLIGWFRSYISIALWPMFWGIADQINIALFQTAGFGSKGVAGSSDLVSVALHLGQSQVMFLMFNIATLFVYVVVIPVISWKIVSGSSEPVSSLVG